MCNWVIMLYSRKLTEHYNPAIKEKNNYIKKERKGKRKKKKINFRLTVKLTGGYRVFSYTPSSHKAQIPQLSTSLIGIVSFSSRMNLYRHNKITQSPQFTQGLTWCCALNAFVHISIIIIAYEYFHFPEIPFCSANSSFSSFLHAPRS